MVLFVAAYLRHLFLHDAEFARVIFLVEGLLLCRLYQDIPNMLPYLTTLSAVLGMITSGVQGVCQSICVTAVPP